MNALVTGATGFLGHHLCQRLVSTGYDLTILCRQTSNTANLSNLKFKKIYGDLTDADAVYRAVEGNNLVFHAAADISYWNLQKDLQNKINIEGTENIVKACFAGGVSKLIHVSSVAAIGIPAKNAPPADETFEFNLEQLPLNYHISKKRAEEIVMSAGKQGLDIVIANPASMWGSFGKSYRGAEIVRKIADGRIMTNYGGGTCLVHVDDVVDGIISIITRGRSGERYILGGENFSYEMINRIIVEKLGVKRFSIQVPDFVARLSAIILETGALVTKRRPRITYAAHYGSSKFLYYNSNKAIKELDYSPRKFDVMVDECISFLNWRKSQ